MWIAMPIEKKKIVTLLFSDMVDSTRVKSRGSDFYARRLERHRELIRSACAQHSGSILQFVGDGTLVEFPGPVAAVKVALAIQRAFFDEAWEKVPVRLRIGLHRGEVLETGKTDVPFVGLALDVAARIQSLALPDQILMSSAVADNARETLPANPDITWRAHGYFRFKGVEDEALEIFEVGWNDRSPLKGPPDAEKALAANDKTDQAMLGWRPGAGETIPNAPDWCLNCKLGEGGFGEVWLASHNGKPGKKVFKFCFHSDRRRSFQVEKTMSRYLAVRLGARDDLVPIDIIHLDSFPYYIASEYVAGGNLMQWSEAAGGIASIPFEQRLTLLVQTARAAAAAHGIGVIHKDIKPANVLVDDSGSIPRARLIDFGIGAMADPSLLDDVEITRLGLTGKVLADNISSRTFTRLYAPPEYLTGAPASVRGDIYALGVLLYQLVIGDLEKPLPTDWRTTISDDLLAEDIARCVAGNPENRFASADDLAKSLASLPERRVALDAARASEQRTIRRQRLTRIGLVAGLCLSLVTAASIWGYIRATRAEETAKVAEAEAVSQRNAAEIAEHMAAEQRDRAELELYRLNIAETEHLINEGQIQEAVTLLSESPERWRGWEYRHVSATLRDKGFPFLHEFQPSEFEFINGVGWLGDNELVALFHNIEEGYIALRALGPDTRPAFVFPSNTYFGNSSFSLGGRRIAVWDEYKDVVLVFDLHDWNTAPWFSSNTFESMHELWPIQAATGIRAGVFNHDGTGFIWMDPHGTVRWWDSSSGQLVREIETWPHEWRENWVRATSLTAAANHFATDTTAGLLLWDEYTGRKIAEMEESGEHWDGGRMSAVKTNGGETIALSPDAKILAVAHGSGEVVLWDIANRRPIVQWTRHNRPVYSLAFSPDGTYLVSGDSIGEVWVYSVPDRKPLFALGTRELAPEDAAVRHISFSPDGSRLVVQHPSRLYVYSTNTRSLAINTLRFEKDQLADFWFMPDDLLLLLPQYPASEPEEVANELESLRKYPAITWNIKTGQKEDERYFGVGGRDDSVLDASGRWLMGLRLPLIEKYGRIQYSRFDLANPDGAQEPEHGIFIRLLDREGEKNLIPDIVPSPNGGKILLCYPPTRMQLVDPSELNPPPLTTHPLENRVQLWDMVSGYLDWDCDYREFSTPPGQMDGSYLPPGASFSPDGTRVVLARQSSIPNEHGIVTHSGVIFTILDAASGKELHTFDLADLPVDSHADSHKMAMRFLHDGRLAVFLRAWKHIVIVDPEGGKESLRLREHAGGVLDMAIHPDGLRMASTAADGTLRIWDARVGRELFALPRAIPLPLNDDKAGRIRFSPDGRYLNCLLGNGKILVLDAPE